MTTRLGAARRALIGFAIGLFAMILFVGCDSSEPVAPTDSETWPPLNLTAFEMFTGDGSDQQPAEGVIPYDLNTPLFTDYAVKGRFIKLPDGESATYHETEAFDFPVGTVIAKTFSMPADMRDPQSPKRLIETRILVHREEGWVGLPYLWNEEQTEATLRPTGGVRRLSWIDAEGAEQKNNYLVPNMNQCKTCHKGSGVNGPIGPTARQLNRSFNYPHGEQNQLAYWEELGALLDAPTVEDAPKLAVWDDPETGTLDQRARAWLEINCAHCHNNSGSARNAGIDLRASQTNPARIGVMKSPAAAGRGTGGHSYDIVPGKPDDSILVYRIESTQPQILMPELGRRLVDKEGAALIRQWIEAMDKKTDALPPEAKEKGAANSL